jgi:phosphoribosyl 1,2-cyclic phosphate phosphodiesterase
LKLTFLGTGTSFGVPVIGCTCPTCVSEDPRDARTRHAAVVETDGGARVLIDTPPELRLQLVKSGIGHIDEVWFTHIHADHVHGIDDLRVFTLQQRRDLTAHIAEEYVDEFTGRFRYVFDDTMSPPRGTSKPEVRLAPFSDDPVMVCGERFQPIKVPHPPVNSYGFRVGDLGYVTDAKTLGTEALASLQGVRVLVLNALWFGDPHPTHLVIEEAVELADRIGAEKTYLTHLTHRARHVDLERKLPPHVRPAFDGLDIEV